MALTPNDVLNKQFATTKFRDGYDQDEVDDFLDEVLAEFQRLTAENEQLKTQVSSAPALDQGELDSLRAQVESSKAEIARLQEELAEAKNAQNDGMNSAEYLQLARRVHEEHVREGVAKRDELIAQGESTAATTINEAQGKAATLISEAQASATALVADARVQADSLVSTAREQADALVAQAQSIRDNELATLTAEVNALDAQRASLQAAVDGLQEFERSYRSSLRAYLEGQLQDLEAIEAPSEAAPAAEPAPTTGETSAAAPSTGDILTSAVVDADAPSATSDAEVTGADAPTGDIPSLAASSFAPPSTDSGATPAASDEDDDEDTTTTGGAATTGGIVTTTGGTTTSSPFPQYTQDDLPPAPGFGTTGSTDEPPRSPFSGFGN